VLPYRIASPPEPEPAESEEPYAAVLRAQRRRARIVSAALVLLVATGLARAVRSGPSHARRPVAEATRVDGARLAIAGARVRAGAAQVRFEAKMREAIGDDLAPRPDLGACPIALPAASSLVRGRTAFPLLTVERAQLTRALPSQAVARVLTDVRRAEAHLAAGRAEEAKLYALALDRPERFGYEVVLVARTAKPPRALARNQYEPGEIQGRAYIYEFTSGRVVCAGDVEARSSREVGYVFSDRIDTPAALGPIASMGDAIEADIVLQTERAVVEGVRWRVEPPRD
jgi:hypothetical protein